MSVETPGADGMYLADLHATIAAQEKEIARYKECAAVLREVVKWRNATSGEYTRWQNAWVRAEQALSALDKEPKEAPVDACPHPQKCRMGIGPCVCGRAVK